ncbi:MAG: hypothetical protein CNIPEHKO_02824 [Anaerolineales bacterium]|nr:hypothetical protein [Anaerolineales bacterium]
MSNEVISALIAGVVSLIVSLLTFLLTTKQMRLEREKLERQLERQLTERLYNLRLASYPEAFRITEPLGKKSGLADVRSISNRLRNWKAAEVSLVLSYRARQAFYDLQEVLKKNPETKSGFSDVQIQKIWHLRNRFRGELRRDLGLMFEEDDDNEIIDLE